MSMTTSINCCGLSVTLTVLRIKQALVGANPSLPLKVTVGPGCDRQRLISSLGPQAKAVYFV